MMLNLYFYRLRNGFTKKYISEYLGVSTKTYSNWENNRTYPKIDKLYQLAKLFEVPINSFIK